MKLLFKENKKKKPFKNKNINKSLKKKNQMICLIKKLWKNSNKLMQQSRYSQIGREIEPEKTLNKRKKTFRKNKRKYRKSNKIKRRLKSNQIGKEINKGKDIKNSL